MLDFILYQIFFIYGGEEMERVKKALKSAIGVGIGLTIGGVIIPRLWLFPNLYNETYPPIFLHILEYFVMSYIVSFVGFWLIDWAKSKLKNSKEWKCWVFMVKE